MRAKVRRGLAIAVGVAMAAGAQAQPLRLAGSGVLGQALAPALMAGFAAAGPARQVSPEVTVGSTGDGFTALAAGRADIAMATRRVTDDERVLVLRGGQGDPAAPGNSDVVALEGFMVLVNRDNAIGILTVDQIRRLFSGQIRNWSALGGRDLPVTIYGRDSQSEAFEAFAAVGLGSDHIAKDAVISGSGTSLAEAVAADPGGIGFARFGEAGSAKPVTIALACGITVEPKPFYARTEEYPLVRRLYFYSGSSKPAPVRDFLAFAISGAAQPIVRRAGLIDLAPEVGVPGDGVPLPGIWEPSEARRRRDILGQITRSLTGARRLSSTFRFAADGSTLDTRAQEDIGRVVAWKRANPGHKVILVGYTGGAGTFDSNLVASAKRAQTVASAMAAAGSAPDLVLAGSTLRPVACDADTAGGLSRRVEVWVH